MLIKDKIPWSFYSKCSLMMIGIHFNPNSGKNSFTVETSLWMMLLVFSFELFYKRKFSNFDSILFKKLWWDDETRYWTVWIVIPPNEF